MFVVKALKRYTLSVIIAKSFSMVLFRQQVTKNILFSWLSFTVRIAVSFLFIPYIASTLGESRYGVWVIVFQTLGYFSLLDFGLERALSKHLAHYLSKQDFGRINRLLSSATALYLGLGTVAIFAAWIVAHYFFGYFQIDDPAVFEEGKTALLIVGLYIGLRFYLVPFGGSLGGFQRHDLANLLQIGEDIIRTLAMVWLLANGYGLATLAMAILITSLARYFAGLLLLKRLHPETNFSPALVTKTDSDELLNYSKISFGITITWLIIFNTDSVILGLFISSAAAGLFAPAMQLFLQIRNVINAIATPLITAVSHLGASGRDKSIAETYLKGVRYASYFSFFASTVAYIYAEPFVALWLPPSFAPTADIIKVLAVGSAFFVPQIIGNAVLFGIERHSKILQVTAIEAALKIALAVILVGDYGLLGIAWANTIPQIILYSAIFPMMVSKELELSARSVIGEMLKFGLISCFIAGLVGAGFTRTWVADNWLMLVIQVGTCTFVSGLVFYFLIDKDEKLWLKTLFKRAL
ncbi:MAG: oligosaccharide flippase family protein [candidate division Zixibacteria bacterium]|nr:oligosaccharide flippase family protein [candidate division Zixibacteria bacterium]